MPITDRFAGKALLDPQRIGHGTLECYDLVKTRRFYEEMLGIECLQTSPLSMMIRLGTQHCYAVVQAKQPTSDDMNMMNHNGLDVGSPDEVDAAHDEIKAIHEKWDIKKLFPVKNNHGDRSFYFCDIDGNWWEIDHVRPGGYAVDFTDDDRDITGLHQLDNEKSVFHTHDPKVCEMVRSARTGQESG